MSMAPRAKSTTAENNRRQPESGPLNAPQPWPVQPSTTPSAPLSKSVCTKRKRSQDPETEAEADKPEDVPLSKQPRRTSPSEHELSRQTLQEDSVAEADTLEDICESEEPQELPSKLRLVQSSLNAPAPISQPTGTERKRPQDSEAEAEAKGNADELEIARPSKQPRELPPSESLEETLPEDSKAELDEQELPPSKDRLSEKNLLLFNGDMDAATNDSRTGSIKRTSSRRSIVAASEAESFRSQRSSSTTAHYRYKHLEDASVYIHVDPPENTQAAIDNIVNAEISKDRHTILRDKAKTFWKRCKEMVRAAAGEDDFVDLFYDFIKDVSPESLISREKADWRVELKPTTQRPHANLSFLSRFAAAGNHEQKEVDDASALPPPKRHQQSAGRLYISPQDSLTALSDSPLDKRLPQPHKSKDTSSIKTPRPDITTGIKKSAVVSTLAASLWSPGFNHTKTEAKQFLEDLQDTTMPGERDAPQEPALIIVPTQRESTLTFPTLLFEGKGYSNGKQVFEAQNQAAVSGACGLKMQLMLDELVKQATKGSDVPSTPSKKQPPLIFSICTEGPHHELWAHYTVIEDGERQFNMVLLDTCDGVLLKQVERFFIQVYNVMVWTAGPFLKTVVERLDKVARRAQA